MGPIQPNTGGLARPFLHHTQPIRLHPCDFGAQGHVVRQLRPVLGNVSEPLNLAVVSSANRASGMFSGGIREQLVGILNRASGTFWLLRLSADDEDTQFETPFAQGSCHAVAASRFGSPDGPDRTSLDVSELKQRSIGAVSLTG